MKKKDILIIALALGGAGLLYAVSQISGGAEATTVVVTVDGQEVLRRPLALEDSYEIRQDDGSLNVIAVEDGAVVLAEDVLPLIGGAQHFAALFEQRPAAAYVVVVAVREQGVPRSQPPLAALLQNAGLGGVDDDAGAFVGGEDVAVCGKADRKDFIDLHGINKDIYYLCPFLSAQVLRQICSTALNMTKRDT